jgi:glycosyltransferase involved in cell wall biosynthesis
MRLAFVSRHNPTPEGSQDGKIFRALVEGLIADGHDVTAMSWGFDQPTEPMPSWCTYAEIPREPFWRTRSRALLRPRWDAARIEWRPPADAVAIAEDPLSWPVVDGHPRAAVLFHYLTKIDAPALRRPTPPDVQDMRHERRVARRARQVFALSDRVRDSLGVVATTVPMAYPMPTETVPFVDAPVAALLASWNWPPNHKALDLLLRAWPEVRDAVPAARLLIAGRGLAAARVGTIAGVEVVGEVATPADVLSRAAVVAYPCPGTSGPKVKVVEAMAHGVAALTTPSGAEGLALDAADGPVVVEPGGFAAELASLLRDGGRRADIAQRARSAVVAAHAPAAAARARVAALGALEHTGA